MHHAKHPVDEDGIPLLKVRFQPRPKYERLYALLRYEVRQWRTRHNAKPNARCIIFPVFSFTLRTKITHKLDMRTDVAGHADVPAESIVWPWTRVRKQ